MQRISLLSFGHFTNDMYGNLATSLAPYFVLAGKLSAPAAGALVLVYLAGSSVLQPLFGIISDRSGNRWFAIAGPGWIAIAMSLLVVAPSIWSIFVLIAIGGIGTAAFHPQGAAMVDRIAGNARGWSMSVFSMGGNLGFGMGPILAALLVGMSSDWSVLVMIPGLICSALLFRYAPDVKSHHMESTGKSLRTAQANVIPLAILVLVIAIRSGAMSAVIFLLPLSFHAQHLPANWGSYGSSLFLLVGAACGLYSGALSDRIGRKPVVVWSLLLSAPFMVAVALLPGLSSWPALAVAGAAILASNSVTVVQAQELLPANTGLAAGLTLGLGFGLSGVITLVISTVSKHAGPQNTLLMAAVLPLVAAGLAAMLPSGRTGSPTAPPVSPVGLPDAAG
jgi:FSR family fosmidomycin resistance protein-like MFS transporter